VDWVGGAVLFGREVVPSKTNNQHLTVVDSGSESSVSLDDHLDDECCAASGAKCTTIIGGSPVLAPHAVSCCTVHPLCVWVFSSFLT
jgi:hypothetical protein